MNAVVVPCPHCAKHSQFDSTKLPPRPVFFHCPHCKGRVVVDKRELESPAAASPAAASPPAALPEESQPPAGEPTVPDRRFAEVPADASFPSGIIVGQDRSVVEEVREALAALGSEVDPVATVEEAGQIIANEQPQLCVCVAGKIDSVPYAPLAPLTRLHPSVRRRLYLMLVGDNLNTGDGNAAFLHQVNLVLGRGDLPRIGAALHAGLGHHERLYKSYFEASEKKGAI